MKDLFNTTVMCNKCHKETIKGFVKKEGFKLRSWKCPTCHEIWIHPADLQEYKKFQEIKNKEFKVKLRMVGNSYTISIPREIVDYGDIKTDEIVKVCLD
ncbi:MAG: hypothetical protein KKA79_04375, partial [Nanoarchaeota archaeon]|nr:hypothetical protein [Nanoarchaeota archaeon]